MGREIQRRLNIRLDVETYDKLAELRQVLGLRGDSETIRTLIRLHHAAERAAIKRLRRVREGQ